LTTQVAYLDDEDAQLELWGRRQFVRHWVLGQMAGGKGSKSIQIRQSENISRLTRSPFMKLKEEIGMEDTGNCPIADGGLTQTVGTPQTTLWVQDNLS